MRQKTEWSINTFLIPIGSRAIYVEYAGDLQIVEIYDSEFSSAIFMSCIIKIIFVFHFRCTSFGLPIFFFQFEFYIFHFSNFGLPVLVITVLVLQFFPVFIFHFSSSSFVPTTIIQFLIIELTFQEVHDVSWKDIIF